MIFLHLVGTAESLGGYGKRFGKRLLARWGASSRALGEKEDDGCDVSDFAVGGCWPVGGAKAESDTSAYCATRRHGCVEVSRRGVGAAVDYALGNATGLVGAVRALARPPPRVAVRAGKG